MRPCHPIDAYGAVLDCNAVPRNTGQNFQQRPQTGVGRDAPPAVLEHVDGGLGDLADAFFIKFFNKFIFFVMWYVCTTCHGMSSSNSSNFLSKIGKLKEDIENGENSLKAIEQELEERQNTYSEKKA